MIQFFLPWWLALLAIPIAMVAWVWWIQRRKQPDTLQGSNPAYEQFGDMFPQLKAKNYGYKAVGVLLVAGMVASVFAAAQPTALAGSVSEQRSTVVVAIDCSPTMTANDVLPTRFLAAQAALKQASVPNGLNLGLVCFGKEARPVVSPTLDRQKFRQGVDQLQIQASDTAIGEGVYSAITSLEAVKSYGGSADTFNGKIVLISDGIEENQPGQRNLVQASQGAKDAGYPIDTILYGTDKGVFKGGPLPYNEEALKEASKASSGTFYTATTGQQLQTALNSIQLNSAAREGSPNMWWTIFGLSMLLVLASTFWYVYAGSKVRSVRPNIPLPTASTATDLAQV